mmetsp:Transcript_28310/g.111164  ORF Transcript_28310/g.111164 Transcript_28310/m.111164 type:complete len:249 (-) Transcript_28310:243-989(-)
MTDLCPDLHPIVARMPPSHSEGESTVKPPFVIGGVHKGFYLSGKHIVSGARDELLRLSEEHPGYDIFITGHSLGASAASLATILLYKDKDYVNRANRTRCVAFGPAPCVTEAVGEAFNGVITSYIFNDDIVSAMEIHTAARFVEMCKEIEKLPFLTRLAIDFGLTRFVSGQLGKIRTPDVDQLQTRVYSAGTVFHIRSDADSIEMAPTRRQTFQDVSFSANALLDHYPAKYESAFGCLLAARRAEVEA